MLAKYNKDDKHDARAERLPGVWVWVYFCRGPPWALSEGVVFALYLEEEASNDWGTVRTF